MYGTYYKLFPNILIQCSVKCIENSFKFSFDDVGSAHASLQNLRFDCLAEEDDAKEVETHRSSASSGGRLETRLHQRSKSSQSTSSFKSRLTSSDKTSSHKYKKNRTASYGGRRTVGSGVDGGSYTAVNNSADSSPAVSPQNSPRRLFGGSRPMSSLAKPLVALAVPGMFLVCKYHQYKRAHQEASKRRAAERELHHLNHKIVRAYNLPLLI